MRARPKLAVWIAACCIAWLAADAAAAQDLFELEVFEYEAVAAGGYEIAFHGNGISRSTVGTASSASNHRPVHLSVEVTRGWTDRFATAVFVQTAPFGPSGSARFAGGHMRGQLRLGELPDFPLRIGISAEYAFNRAAFDHDLQTLEIRPILDFANGRLSLVANPSLELVTRGSDEGVEPVFDVSVKGGWQLTRRMALTGDYYSAVATTRHLQPEPEAHHLIFGGLDLEVAGGWELGISAGHCITNGEPWLMKSVVGYRF